MTLTPTYHDLPAGHLAPTVTFLQMDRPPAERPVVRPEGVSLEPVPGIDPDRYLEVYRRVGEPWLWTSRAVMPRPELAAILGDERVEVHVLRAGDGDEGLVELDFREDGICELAYFGLAPGRVGQGTGRFAMALATRRAWSRGIRRFQVHTCTYDHPAALSFYKRSGFDIVRRAVEVFPDPRLDGSLPRGAAPHVPLAD